MEREPNTQYILSLSYGKDSIACIEAVRQLGYPLDRIVHAEVWATDDIPADLPPMVEFKARADKIIKERYGIEVEHVYATRGGVYTFEQHFYGIAALRETHLRETVLSHSETSESLRGGDRRMAETRERVRSNQSAQKSSSQFSVFRFQEEHGATAISRSGVCDQAFSQGTIKGFPNAGRRIVWCNDLKRGGF